MTSLFSSGASAFSVNDGSDVSPDVTGYHSSWNTSDGPPLSRASCAITAERLPPAESPATAMRAGSPPSSAACSPTHRNAAQAVLDALRVRVFGGQSVVDRHHDGLGADGVRAGHVVVGVQVADAPTAAVIEDDHRQVVVLRDRRPVDAHRNVVDLTVPDDALLDPHLRQHLGRRSNGAHPFAGHLDTVVDGEFEGYRVHQGLEDGVDGRSRRRFRHTHTLGRRLDDSRWTVLPDGAVTRAIPVGNPVNRRPRSICSIESTTFSDDVVDVRRIGDPHPVVAHRCGWRRRLWRVPDHRGAATACGRGAHRAVLARSRRSRR